MIVCPVCDTAMMGLPPSCPSCLHSAYERDGVLCFVSHDKVEIPFEATYYEAYDRISAQDLDQSIVPPEYAREMNAAMADFVGDVTDAEICDLGCGRGTLSCMLAERGAASVTAVDISLDYLRKLSGTDRIEPVLANAEALPYQNAFDVIVSTDVLEHVLNVGSYFYCLNRALRTGGRAFVRVPYRESLMAYSPHMGCPEHFVHLRSFDRPLLTQAFRNAGFEVTGSKLCGFFFGRPRPFWSRTQHRMDTYVKLRDRIARSRRGMNRVAGWPYWLAGFLMEPVAIMMAARKITSLEPLQAARGQDRTPDRRAKGPHANAARRALDTG